ncbi:hypothetical protein EEJ34_18910 [Vibrio cholerae]|nr:hypothetical protein [Vibrio cholerae]MCA3928963.1 hypothetical protein [Vibrio vulnificus]EHU8078546.1 hypothetical protein [Vibrio cholerae]EHV9954586.1 hypothetical protein [Vibrio cholerae]EHZ7431581.1 hypothetical protein [Vibrio cholerae]
MVSDVCLFYAFA